ncbi:PrsW family intramembrane metalloprotease [Candidatus Gracilibacteria bacterium]|nr:PrsW family intramembrane metalloprotease [Candidatus Gracilibacteria bacterium]MCF7819084.1 PrsW family intramembrane metalloprotease [Candidatus Gracilibacteria bacterium]
MQEFLDFISQPQILWYVILSFLPILGWLYFFQKKHPEKRSYVVLTFLAGMLSVVPIKLYEKYWDVAVFYFEHINVFEYLADLIHIPDTSKFLAYITINALVGVGLFLFTCLMMGVLEIFTRDNTLCVFRKKIRKALESPLFFIAVGIFCGIVAYGFSFSFHERVWFFVVVGMLEEFIKHLVLRFSDDEKILSVDDALSFAIIVALGFAFVENILYLHNFVENTNTNFQQFSLFFLLRSTVSVVAHVCFSAILGYFYGVARFSEDIYRQEVMENKHVFFRFIHKIFHLKGETLFHEEKMMEGMILAMVAHAIFNSLLEFGKVYLLFPFLFLLFFFVLNLFHRKQVYRQSGDLLHTSFS